MILMSIQNILKEFRQHTAKNPAAGRALLQDHKLTRSVCQRIVPAFSVDFITNSCHGHNQRRKPPNMGTITFYIRKFTTADFHIYNHMHRKPHSYKEPSDNQIIKCTVLSLCTRCFCTPDNLFIRIKGSNYHLPLFPQLDNTRAEGSLTLHPSHCLLGIQKSLIICD